jgi:hypothetical protein
MLSADRFCVVNHRNEVMEAEGTPAREIRAGTGV